MGGFGSRPDPWRWRGPRTGQRGSGTLLVAATILVLMLLAGCLTLIAGFIAAAHAARGAADLVALSAAAKYAEGQDACSVARRLAGSNRVRLTSCRVTGDSLDFVVAVTVEQPYRVWVPVLPQQVSATAYAGRLGIIG